MFPDELEAAFAACPAAWFAYGLCEPHGPQNVLGLDGLKAHALLVRAALGGQAPAHHRERALGVGAVQLQRGGEADVVHVQAGDPHA